MIFLPLYETTYFGIFRYQGLFLKRQKEVSSEFGNLIANKILTPKKYFKYNNIWKSSRKYFQYDSDVLHSLSQLEGFTKPLLEIVIGTEKYEKIKNHILHRITSILNQLKE